jgi:hypothetical protein
MSDRFQNYVFASSNESSLLAASSFENMERVCDEFFAVSLVNEKELELLMSLLGVSAATMTSLPTNEDFSALFDFSASCLPQLDGADFDAFYDEWLRKSGRESTMDEYCQLIFLQGRATYWNTKSSWFVLLEKA